VIEEKSTLIQFDVHCACQRSRYMTEATPSQTTYSRVMLKISGEALMGETGFGLHPPTVERIAQEVKSVHDMGVEICMVIGGGAGGVYARGECNTDGPSV
jgi:hypothetical protein